MRGRGAVANPAGRFERLTVEHVEDEDAGVPRGRVETEVLRDTSRSIITRNSSPDIPFDASLNPYRGCEHGCTYCLEGETPVLLADGTTRPLADLRVGDEIYGTVRSGRYRRFVPTRVLAQWETTKPAYEITLGDGTRLVASADHRLLTERGWKFVTGAGHGAEQRPFLTTNNKLMGTGRFARGPDLSDDAYRRGYLCGLVRGDGHLATYEYSRPGRSRGRQHQFRLALVDGEPLDRARRYLADFDVPVTEFTFQEARASRRALSAIRTHARAGVEKIRELVSWPSTPCASWRRGFLAGIYDAEGAFDRKVLRISNTDRELIDWITRCLQSMGFGFLLERPRRESGRPIEVIRLTGGLREYLRFWHTAANAIGRKRDVAGRAIKSSVELGVRSIVPVGERLSLFDITTGTGDFIADGVVSHNCYARPTHEFLGFSAGLDFESRILVKEDAAELLGRELGKPSWTPRTLALSGVTDPYQPVERRFGVTRGCLEVLAERRHPVAVITKSALVLRDVDLLAELARWGAVRVALSVTTLEVDLARRMEPRASSPRERLRAISELAAAGIPTSVMVAPVVPGLTDHEIPAILEAAARAGADSAGYVPLRLPGAVAGLFEAWLEERFPDRKEKVLNRVRSLRGGRLNDPRFGSRMRGNGVFADQIHTLFTTSRRRWGLERRGASLSVDAFRRPGDQLALFAGADRGGT